MTSDQSLRACAILTVDLGAVVANWTQLRDRVAPAECSAVVKADAYGLGVAQVVPALAAAGCRTFVVAQLEEALAVRRALEPVAPRRRSSRWAACRRATRGISSPAASCRC